MARNYILGGMAATQLQAGKPYFKRIIRANGTGTGFDEAGDENANPALNILGPLRPDGFTVKVAADDAANPGAIRKDGVNARGEDWGTTGGGELLMVEFPTTMRNVQILVEEAWADGNKEDAGDGAIRAKVMLAAPGQDVSFPEGNIAQPVSEMSYIEIRSGETATINSRQKVIFILIEKHQDANILDSGVLKARPNTGNAGDAISLLITGVLDHEPTAGAANASQPVSRVIAADGSTSDLTKIWGAGDGIA